MEIAPYPPQAREMKLEGTVNAMLSISETGDVKGVHVFNGDALLAKSVEEAVSKWKFKPVMKGESPIPVAAKAVFIFVLSDSQQMANGVRGEITEITDAPKRVRVSSGVSAGLLVRKVSPTYPDEARRAGIQGTVLLHAVIGRDGTISDLQPISGPPELIPSAVEAAKLWRYKPYLLLGLPMEVETQLQINFVLSR